MPTSYSPIVVSGMTSPGAGPEVYVTFDSNQLQYEGNAAAFGNQDKVPSWMFFCGTPAPYKDSAGNVVWRSANADGTMPT